METQGSSLLRRLFTTQAVTTVNNSAYFEFLLILRINEILFGFFLRTPQPQWNFEVRKPSISLPFVAKLTDQAFFLLAFVACTAMGRAATSLSRLANTAREELPSTMAAIRLSG